MIYGGRIRSRASCAGLTLLLGAIGLPACESGGVLPPTEPEPPAVPAAGGLLITPGAIHFDALGVPQYVQVSVWDASGQPVPHPHFVWETLDESVARAGGDAWVEPVGNGSTRLIAIYGGFDRPVSDTIDVTVRQVVTAVYPSPGRRGFYVGDTLRFEAIAYDRSGSPVDDAAITWSSDSPHTVAIDSTGFAEARGSGSTNLTATVGTFGRQSTLAASVPVAVVGEADFVDVQSGFFHACALRRSGEVHCWGAGTGTRLPGGTLRQAEIPKRVRAAPAFASITAGGYHTCGLTAAGDAYCWGGNLFGQLGNGIGGLETDARETPQRVVGGHRFRRITAGTSHTCGVTETGRAYCWGSNDYGELGIGTSGNADRRTEPVPVASDARFTSISAGNDHTCAVTSHGEAYCWGEHTSGKLGTGGGNSGTGHRETPVRTAAEHSFLSIHAVGDHTCGMTGGGAIYCWGGWSDVHPDHTVSPRVIPTPVAAGLDIVQVAEGGWMCGVDRHGTAYCWGPDDEPPSRIAAEVPFVSMSAGLQRSCALGRDERVYCWGRSVYGMGDGRSSDSETAVLVSAPFDPTE